MKCASEIKRLQACPDPEPFESLMGYLLRLTMLNGYDHVAQLFQIAGYVGRAYDFQRLNLEGLSALVNQPENTLRDLTYQCVGNRKRLFLGNAVPSMFLQSRHTRICPTCIHEDGFFPAYWDLRLLTCCEEHRSYLVDTCPSCSRKIQWYRPMWNLCNCGYDFKSIVPEIADEKTLKVNRMILTAITGDEGQVLNVTLPAELQKANPDGLLKSVMTVGMWAVGQHEKRMDDILRMSGVAEISQMMSAAYDIFTDWPKNFNKFLSQVQGRAKSRKSNQTYFSREFGSLYLNTVYHTDGQLTTMFKEAFWKYADKPLTQPQPVKKEITRGLKLYGAADDAGITVVALRKMVASDSLNIVKAVVPGIGNVLRVDEETKGKLTERISSRVRYKEFRSLLGLGQKTADRLKKSSLFVADETTILDGRGDESFLREEIDALLKTLNELATQLPVDTPQVNVSALLKEVTYCTCAQFSFADLIELICSGALSIYKDCEFGNFKDFYVNRNDIFHHLAMMAKYGAENLLHIEREGPSLGISAKGVNCLVKKGVLQKTVNEFGGRSYAYVDKVELTSWLKQHVMGVAVGKRHNIPNNKIQLELSEMGLFPVWEPIGNDINLWYCKDDLVKHGIAFNP